MAEGQSVSVQAVERFAVVHGQIIANQFKHFPNKAIQNCAFLLGLTRLMEARRHCKLYMGKKAKAGRAGGNANPMKDRSVKGRPTPMTATATNLVKAVWVDYFKGSQDENAGDGARSLPALVLSAPLAVACMPRCWAHASLSTAHLADMCMPRCRARASLSCAHLAVVRMPSRDLVCELRRLCAELPCRPHHREAVGRPHEPMGCQWQRQLGSTDMQRWSEGKRLAAFST